MTKILSFTFSLFNVAEYLQNINVFKIVLEKKSINKWISIQSACNNILSISDVWKCLYGTAPKTYKNYFIIIEHNIITRINKKNNVLPKVKTECGGKSFMFQGAKRFYYQQLLDQLAKLMITLILDFNLLPTDLKEEESITKFRFKTQDIFYS